MHRFSRRAVPAAAAFIVSTLLAACGGGGGGGSVPVPGPSLTGQPFTPKASVRATMQTALTAVQTSATSSSATGVAGIARRVDAIRRGAALRRTAATPTCTAGYETTGTVQNPDGSVSETNTWFYDTACTAMETQEVLTILASQSSGMLVGTGSVTSYARSGAVTLYTTLSLQETTSAPYTVTIAETDATSVGGTPFAKIGTTCTAATVSSMTCSAADVDAVASGQTGASLQEQNSLTSSAQGTSASATVTASAYSAASGLNIAQNGTTWSVTGAAPLDTVTGSITLTSAATGTISGGSISLNDASSGIAIAGTFGASGITFTATQSGTTLGSLTVDANGNGTLTYADGTTATITNWTITS